MKNGPKKDKSSKSEKADKVSLLPHFTSIQEWSDGIVLKQEVLASPVRETVCDPECSVAIFVKQEVR